MVGRSTVSSGLGSASFILFCTASILRNLYIMRPTVYLFSDFTDAFLKDSIHLWVPSLMSTEAVHVPIFCMGAAATWLPFQQTVLLSPAGSLTPRNFLLLQTLPPLPAQLWKGLWVPRLWNSGWELLLLQQDLHINLGELQHHGGGPERHGEFLLGLHRCGRDEYRWAPSPSPTLDAQHDPIRRGAQIS